MESYILNWLESAAVFAIWLSVILNIVISVLGVVPSVFITSANIKFFGFENGLLISILGEAAGAIISFYLYRKGLTKLFNKEKINNQYAKKLMRSKGVEAFLLILSLRIFPFVPSGAVTLAGAASRVSIVNFSAASTLGKIPALFAEAYSIQQVINWNWQGKFILGFVSLFFVILLIRKSKRV